MALEGGKRMDQNNFDDFAFIVLIISLVLLFVILDSTPPTDKDS